MSKTVKIETGGIADFVRTWSYAGRLAKHVRDSQSIEMSRPAVFSLLLVILQCHMALAVSSSLFPLPAGFRLIPLFRVNIGEIAKPFAISLRSLFERTLFNCCHSVPHCE